MKTTVRDIRLDESGFRFGECIREAIGTCLQNYAIVYMIMAAVTKFIAKNNKTTTSASKTT